MSTVVNVVQVRHLEVPAVEPFGLRHAIPRARSTTGVATSPAGGRPAGGDHADNALHPAAGRFPLGRPFGMLPVGGMATTAEALPYGLRQAVPPAVVAVGDLTRYGYDHARQIGVVHTPDGLVPLARHTDGRTSTRTNPDGNGGPDSDQDVRED